MAMRPILIQRPFLVTLISLLVLGCADGSFSGPQVTVWDSAGVTIVESSVPAWGPGEGWTVDAEPFLDLAGFGPIEDLADLDARMIHEFSEVRDAARLQNGGIAVMDSYTREIRSFSAIGDHLWTVGRFGEGPGEFSRLWSLDRYRADSLVVFDYELQRATVISPLGEVARVIPRIASVFFVKDLIPMADGTLLIQPIWQGIEVYEGEFGVFHRQSLPIVRLSPEGVVSDTVAMLAGLEWFMTEQSEAEHPFQKDSHVGAYEGMVYLGDAERLEYRILEPSGQLQRIVRVPGADLSISKEDLEQFRDIVFGLEPTPAQLRWFSQQELPETKPAFSDLLVDTEGYVWLEVYRHRKADFAPQAVSDWNVFSPAGEWLGSVRLPARFEVFEIGRDYVLGRKLDEEDVPHPQLLRLDRN